MTLLNLTPKPTIGISLTIFPETLMCSPGTGSSKVKVILSPSEKDSLVSINMPL